MRKILYDTIALHGNKYFATLITCQKLIDILVDTIALLCRSLDMKVGLKCDTS